MIKLHAKATISHLEDIIVLLKEDLKIPDNSGRHLKIYMELSFIQKTIGIIKRVNFNIHHKQKASLFNDKFNDNLRAF